MIEIEDLPTIQGAKGFIHGETPFNRFSLLPKCRCQDTCPPDEAAIFWQRPLDHLWGLLSDALRIFPAMFRFLTALTLVLPSILAAHQVPNITAEAMFHSDGAYTLRISLDPRVFLSNQPTSLPPVPADWFTSQSADEVEKTWTQAGDYLRDSFHLQFEKTATPLPEPAFQAMDGATNKPISPETAEVHILATMEGSLPETTGESLPFEIQFGQNANTSLILLNSIDGKPERRPQVLFPGETSRPFAIPAATPSIAAVAEAPMLEQPEAPTKESENSLLEREKQHEEFIARSRWWVLASAVLLALILKRILFPKEK